MFVFGAIPNKIILHVDAEPVDIALPDHISLIVPEIAHVDPCRGIMKHIFLMMAGLIMLIGGITVIIIIVFRPDTNSCQQSECTPVE
jgi:hypothetical protein